ncbi:Histidine triad nucleotide-binding protein 3 [Hondaea fermentalgiana]|uniref:Histidine triad nucleotide-binding protein 3 n=1 Tax=Hondaea fermentalgiana TaxID=2315210 RepID=A0A2R5GLV5_9STRA|nr:Histidine triad nucleotide-binding protein 3 [Hondaea fermentalgiana]|eukprot:GBG31882.1 Histidine triad nucleotide-binding protein 3 [Hondaea fermentalgiana]
MGATASYYAALPFAWAHYGMCHLRPNVFALMLDGEIPVDKLYEDDQVMVIRDKYPAADYHLLVIPKEKIKECTSLTKEHASLVEHMMEVGKRTIEAEGSGDRRVVYGFMTPPFNTQLQLHMHCISMPLKVTGIRASETHMSQFASAQDVLDNLRS